MENVSNSCYNEGMSITTRLKKRYLPAFSSAAAQPGPLPEKRATRAKAAHRERFSVLLIHPLFSHINDTTKRTLPVGLCYLAASIKKNLPEVTVRIYDAHIMRASPREIARVITGRRWDVIGISYWSVQAESAFAISRFVKKNTQSFLVHGGVHATLLPEEALRFADCVVLHEGEETFLELLRSKIGGKTKLRDIRGIAFKHQGALTRTPARPYLTDLDALPFPDYSLLPLERYDSPMHVTGGRRLPLIGSRGCPYNCTFCTSPIFWERKLRMRSPENIVAEIQRNIADYGIRAVHFWDDNMLIRRDWMEKLCRLILEKKLRLVWCGLSRAEHIVTNRGVLALMKRSGCVGIEIGIESFSDQAAEIVAKGENTSHMLRAAMLMKKAGIAPLYTHMIFTPGETIASYPLKQRFLDRISLKRFNADSALGQATTPHQKTAFAREAPKLGVVLCREHGHYNHQRTNFIPFSLLRDVPVKRFRGDGMEHLRSSVRLISTAFFWTPQEIQSYLTASFFFLKLIDGAKTVERLADGLTRILPLPREKALEYCALATMCLARKGLIGPGKA